MSLLSVTVKKARYVGIQATQFNTYVTLKLQNVKSTTVTVKGPTPSWEQDFLFETNDINLGLLVEVWNKGVIWDRALGYHYLPLTSVAYNEEVGGRWVELEAQLMMRGGAVVGTSGPTGHALLLDCRFEPPFDAEGTGGADLQRKLDLLNGALDAERAEQARRQMQYIAHSGYSEDSDYTSDLNYPVGQHANCSASQFRSAAQMHTPQRSLEVSRENSYERDEYHIHGDTDPLYYNSQPRTNRIDTWSQLHAQASVESAISWRTAADWQSQEDQRRPSLERQSTLYDDEAVRFSYDTYTASTHIRDHSHLSQQASYEEYFDSSSYPYQTSYVGDDTRLDSASAGRYYYDDTYGQDPNEFDHMSSKRRSSIVHLPQIPTKQQPFSSRYSDNEMAPYQPRSRRVTASLPATPSSTPKRNRALPVPPGSESGSIRGARGGRKLPRLPYKPPAAAAALTQKHVPYRPEPEKRLPKVPVTRYDYVTYGYQAMQKTTALDETNYNTSSTDDEGTQPFFNETPHATPPASHKWSETDTVYGATSDSDTTISKPTVLSYMLPRPSVTTKHDTSYQDTSYQDTGYQDTSYQDTSYQHSNYQESSYDGTTYSQNQYSSTYLHEDQQYQQQHHKKELPYQDTYQDQTDFQQHSYDYQYQEEPKQFQQETYHDQQYQHQQYQDQQYQHQHQQAQQQQYQQDQQYLKQQQQQTLQQHHLQQQQQQSQQKQAAQQLQTTVLTGAATLGSLMAGGAKKLGSLFGAAAAAVSTPAISHPQPQLAATAPVSQYSSAGSSVTPFSSTITAPVASVPQASPSVPAPNVSMTGVTPVTLPRTPSLKRQESIQRPSVRRTRTLPEAPDDMLPSSYESAYEDDYHKTESDQLLDRDRTSLDRYHDDEYLHDTIPEEPSEEIAEETSLALHKTSPTRNVIHTRKPSVDSYHSQAPSIVERKPSQTSFHLEEQHIPTTQEQELPTDKSKVSFQVDRKKFHEVPEEEAYIEEQPYDEQGTEYQDDQQYDHNEEAEQDEQFNETDEQYQDSVFQEENREEERIEFHPEQPKLTARQRWHRAYNMIVNQLNVSHFILTMIKAEKM